MRHVHTVMQREDRFGMSHRRVSRRANAAQRRRIKWLTTAVAAMGAVWPCSQSAVNAASTDSWIAGSSNWNSPVNWSLGVVPGTLGPVSISDNDAQDRTITYDYIGSTVTLSTLTVVNIGGGTNALTIGGNNSGLLATTELIGNSGSGSTLSGVGVLIQSASMNTVSTLYLGFNSRDTGTYLFQDGAVTAGNVYVGYSGTGEIDQSAGIFGNSGNGGTVYLGYNSGATGVWNLNSGEASLVNETVYIGYGSGSTGSMTLGTGNPTLTCSDVQVGNEGTGTFIQESGTTEIGTMAVSGSCSVDIDGGGLFFVNTNSSGSGWFIGKGTGVASCTMNAGYVGISSI